MELLEQLASDTSTAELPIIALSKHSDLDQVERVWKNGVSDYLATPNTPVILERKVARFLSEVPLSSDSDEVPTTDDEEIETAPTDDNLEPVEVGV
ncbi:MAG: PleD family two-component response regulator [Planctomycetaceae bacterium]